MTHQTIEEMTPKERCYVAWTLLTDNLGPANYWVVKRINAIDGRPMFQMDLRGHGPSNSTKIHPDSIRYYAY